MPHYDVLIVGAGHAGAQAAIALRQSGYSGNIGLVGAEPDAPYERPPLSKDYLAGEKPFERILIRPLAFWSERQIDLLPGREVVSVEAHARRLTCANGESYGYKTLIWAAGGRPRRLACPGSNLRRIHSVRSRADVDRLVSDLPSAQRVTVIGGGYIGLEAAAVLTKLGKKVTLIETAERVLSRVASDPISRFFEEEHRRRGVEVRTGIAVEQVLGDVAVAGARLSSGETIASDMVIVGIGIEPTVEPLLGAGAQGGNGVDVDDHCRTSLEGVYAIGDCAAHPNPFAGGDRVRIESVQNAVDQANVVARAIAGTPEAYRALPWFWSNQYELRLQTVGLSRGYDDWAVRGRPDSASFSVLYLREGAVIALDCVNRTKDYVQGRKLILDRRRISKSALADESVPLKEL